MRRRANFFCRQLTDERKIGALLKKRAEYARQRRKGNAEQKAEIEGKVIDLNEQIKNIGKHAAKAKSAVVISDRARHRLGGAVYYPKDDANKRSVKLDRNCIEVPAKKAKSARRRIVKIQPRLDAWILPCGEAGRPLSAFDFFGPHHMLGDAIKAAKLMEWVRNGLRHRFASYHLAHWKDAAALVPALR